MAEKVLKVKTVSDVSEAISGLTDLSGSLKGVGTAAFEAAGKSKGQWKELEEEWQKANPALKGVADSAIKVEGALNQMGRAGSISQLESSLVKTKIVLDQFKAKLEEVRAAGGTIDEGVRSSVAVMESGFQAGTEKLKYMKEQTAAASAEVKRLTQTEAEAAEAAKRLAAEQAGAGAAAGKAAGTVGVLKDQTTGVAKGMMAASGAVGPFGEILEKLQVSGTGATSKFAGLAFQVIAAGAAFKIGYDAGTRFNSFLQEHGNLLEKAIDGTVNWVTGLKSEDELLSALPGRTNAALEAKRRLNQETKDTLDSLQKEAGGWKDLDKVRAEALQRAKDIGTRYLQLKAEGKDWRSEMELQGDSIRATADLLNKLGVGVLEIPFAFQTVTKEISDFDAKLDEAARRATLTGDGIRGLRDTLAALPASLKDFRLSEVIDGLSKAIASARAEGKDWSVILSDYTSELTDLAIAAEKAGVDGIDLFRKKILDLLPVQAASIVSLDAQAKKLEEVAQRAAAARAAEAASIQKAVDDAVKMREAAEAEGKARRENTTATEASERAQRQWSEATHDGIVEMDGWVGVMGPAQVVTIEMTKASDAATEALLRRWRATKLLREEQLEAVSQDTAYRDYIANIVEAEEVGLISLTTMIGLLSQLRTQLLTMFGTVSGDAKKEVDALTASITALIATAGAGSTGPRDNSYAGEFQRRFGGSGRGKGK